MSATHETDHRFTVYGLVKDAGGVPQVNIKVMVSDTLTGEGNTVFTDQKGHYEVLLHLHNSNLGDEIRISAGNEVRAIKAEFNPADKQTERKSEVNVLLAPSRIPAKEGGWSIVAGVLFVAGLIFLSGILFKQKKSEKKSAR